MLSLLIHVIKDIGVWYSFATLTFLSMCNFIHVINIDFCCKIILWCWLKLDLMFSTYPNLSPKTNSSMDSSENQLSRCVISSMLSKFIHVISFQPHDDQFTIYRSNFIRRCNFHPYDHLHEW
jgi:hypothetical protein